jgi:hypothetical protein
VALLAPDAPDAPVAPLAPQPLPPVVPLSGARAIATLEAAVHSLQGVVRATSPSSLSGDEARALVDLLAEAERSAASGMALFSPRVVETGAHAKAGHGSATQWFSTVSGSSASAAKGRLALAQAASTDEALTEALHQSELSTPQLKLMSAAETATPGSAGRLLGLAAQGASHQELSDAAARIGAAARSKEHEVARRARVHEHRHFRWHQSPGGGISGEFSCDEIAWARIAPGLEAQTQERWKGAGKREGIEAHRLDALLALLGRGDGGGGGGTSAGSPGPRSTPRPGARPHTIVIIDAAALRRGTAVGDELCEIEGLGPVCVDAVLELVGEGAMQLLVKDGVDVRTVTSTRRDLPQRIEAALLVRDRTCVVPGCGQRRGLQGDHCQVDFGDNGPTEMANLARLCPPHHDLKTYGGFALKGGPEHWEWIPPKHPKTARQIERARQIATGRAKAKRNNPRLT